MKRIAALLAGLFFASAAHAVDHDNIDAGRPLLFDDAASIAYGERAFEFGAALEFPRHGSGELGLSAEYLSGFARNTHVSVGFDPTLRSRYADPGDLRVGVFRSLNRETREMPARAVRADLSLPMGRERGAEIRLRGILSRSVKQYSRLHLNADAAIRLRPATGERAIQPALILGLTRPLGYPTRFDRTGLAEIAVRAGERKNSGAILSAGVGLRQQVTVRAVFDIGIRSDIAALGKETNRSLFRLTTGYSTQF